MFVVTSKPTFIAPVLAKIPGDNGNFQRIKFSVIFKALDKPAIDELLARIRSRSPAFPDDAIGTGNTPPEPIKDRELIDELLVGFGPDLVEEDRTPMAFSPANVDRLCAIWPLESAIVKSFFDNYINGPTKN
ncbi:MAG: hypothetical protein NTZ64_15105 [Polaromonas sp.]|nr:hypothetical protein [Polaromonas sp.]